MFLWLLIKYPVYHDDFCRFLMFPLTLTYTSAVIYFALISSYSAGLCPFCGPIVRGPIVRGPIVRGPIVLQCLMHCLACVFINFVFTSCLIDCDQCVLILGSD